MGKSYMMGDIAEELKINKTKVFRCIKELKLEAINENTREHLNSPKKYSKESKDIIVASLTNEENRTELQNKALQEHYETLQNVSETEKGYISKDSDGKGRERSESLRERSRNDSEEIIELLKSQLESRDQELDKAYQEKQDLIRLLDQQQRLSLQANQKIETLEYKEKEIKEELLTQKKKRKSKWYDIFKR